MNYQQTMGAALRCQMSFLFFASLLLVSWQILFATSPKASQERTVGMAAIEGETNTVADNESERSGTMTIPRHTSTALWEPSDLWINECIQEQQNNNPDLDKPYPVQWLHYQLGDCLRMCVSCGISERASQYGSFSIAGRYWKETCNGTRYGGERGVNYTFLMELFQSIETNPIPSTELWPLPETDELVIHLRLGDVMDEAQYVGNVSVFEMLRSGATTRHGANSPFPNGIKSIYEYLERIRHSGMEKVVLRGGSHKPEPYPKSKIYSMCLAKAIQTAGFNLTNLQVLGESNPDQDFYYMSHSKHFIQGTGGYSRIVGNLVKALGGTVTEMTIYNF